MAVCRPEFRDGSSKQRQEPAVELELASQGARASAGTRLVELVCAATVVEVLPAEAWEG